MLTRGINPCLLGAGTFMARFNVLLLAGAWLAAWLVYSPVIHAGWLYDDIQHVVNDPRHKHLELFSPQRWSDPHPSLESPEDEAIFLPNYNKPLYADRFIWRLSFALERALAGSSHSPAIAHAVNLLLHLAVISALFFALTRLVELYFSRFADRRIGPDRIAHWQCLPGLAAIVFSVHPWAAEPVCYVSARSGSLGALFVLLGVGFWSGALLVQSSRFSRILQICLAAACALAAFSSKENFITAPAAYFLVTWPILWRRAACWKWHIILPSVLALILVLCFVAFLGIRYSDRAGGLWAQVGGRGWNYFFEIQNPLVLMTLLDQVPALRLSLETNHPMWPVWACAVALGLNVCLVSLSLVAGLRWPLLLGLTWFYLHLVPTNSFLPRPDFLAARNVYLPVAGIATLAAGGLLAAWSRWLRNSNPVGTSQPVSRTPWLLMGVASTVLIYWGMCAWTWANAFVSPEKIWARCAIIAPDHATVRLNLACAMLNAPAPTAGMTRRYSDAKRETHLALAAESSATMKFHTERPRQVRHALAARLLALIHYANGDGYGSARYYRESWTLLPSLAAWTGWALVSFENNLSQEMADAVTEGQQHWPDAWWPLAVRGLHRAGNSTDTRKIEPDIIRDLETAERAPDAVTLELRLIQRYALYQLVQAGPAKPRESELLKRLKHFW